ncbi:hypothetical protein J437_LFUL015201 [Ladona fulva]|uniref:PiggyBac transposable element-derived protein domain-containing protein n=1 Tax=Ladona fulva TaxID=123851 RepID=A0A8K0P623_LADFU|nr:hypothetical protein J437_LFUL015201 [Ladona fulva]
MDSSQLITGHSVFQELSQDLINPIFGKLMERDRYPIILSTLHFSDNNVSNEGDMLYKIRAVVDQLLAAFKNTLVPFQNLCIDESI